MMRLSHIKRALLRTASIAALFFCGLLSVGSLTAWAASISQYREVRVFHPTSDSGEIRYEWSIAAYGNRFSFAWRVINRRYAGGGPFRSFLVQMRSYPYVPVDAWTYGIKTIKVHDAAADIQGMAILGIEWRNIYERPRRIFLPDQDGIMRTADQKPTADEMAHAIASHDIEIHIPFWMIFAGASIYPAIRIFSWMKRRRLRRTGLCTKCSYDLRSHAPGDKCPECGTPIPSAPKSGAAPGSVKAIPPPSS